MPYVNVGQENSGAIDLYYEDLGQGQPVVLVHGWPLSGRSWEKQAAALLAGGYRVITYDRRGFGASSQPSGGYDYDTLADDLHKLVGKLDLRGFALVGFSMGGGEVARYIGRYGSQRVSNAVIMAAVTPCLRKAADNPNGIDGSVFAGIQKAIVDDRPKFLSEFLSNFFNVDKLGGSRISDQAVQANWNIAVGASPKGSHDCVGIWGTDFREDLAKFKLPTLVMHGDSDRAVPLEVSGALTHKLVPGSQLVVIKDGPHGINWTHAEEVNRALLDFLKQN